MILFTSLTNEMNRRGSKTFNHVTKLQSQDMTYLYFNSALPMLKFLRDYTPPLDFTWNIASLLT